MIILFIAIVVAALAALSLGLVSLAIVEHNAVVQNGYTVQLTQVVLSGVDAAAKAIDDPAHPDLIDNPSRFCGIEVISAELTPPGFGAGCFTVFSPRLEQEQVRGVRSGLTRESAKLSLEAVLNWENESPGQGVRALEKLPGMTPVMVDSTLDWLDTDNDVRPQGAESAYYQQEQKTYRPRNAVPIALGELLLIRDVEQALIVGEDNQLTFGANQATLRIRSAAPPFGSIDPFAPLLMTDSTISDTPARRRGQRQGQSRAQMQEQSFGNTSAWQFLLTPYSAEKLVNPQGVVRVFLNESNLEFLESQLRLHQLDDESVRFIMQWRRERGNIGDTLDLLDVEMTGDVPSDIGPIPALRSSLFSVSTPEAYERFLKLLDETTTESGVVLRGRINVNEAPRPVLEAVPELTPELVTTILARRRPGLVTQRHAVWLLAEGVVDLATMRALSRRLTTGGDVYRIQVAGFFEDKPMFHRAEVVLDATVKPPRMVFYKELTPLGFPD